MNYIKRRIRTALLNLMDLASSITELKALKFVFKAREAEVKLRFPYITTVLMTFKVAMQIAVVYFLLTNLSLEYGLLGFMNKEYIFHFYLVMKVVRYLYYLVGIMDSLISDESFISKHLNKRRRATERELCDIEKAREKVLLWGDQYISKDKIEDV